MGWDCSIFHFIYHFPHSRCALNESRENKNLLKWTMRARLTGAAVCDDESWEERNTAAVLSCRNLISCPEEQCCSYCWIWTVFLFNYYSKHMLLLRQDLCMKTAQKLQKLIYDNFSTLSPSSNWTIGFLKAENYKHLRWKWDRYLSVVLSWAA